MESERKSENTAFLEAKADDEGAIKLLEQAIESLSSFYKNNPPALLQTKQEPGPDEAPDATFTDANKSKGENKGIVAILEMLKEDLQAEIDRALCKSKSVLKALLEKKANLKQSIVETNDNIDEKGEDITDLNGLLSSEKSYLSEIKPDCDWILGEFQ